MRYRPKDLAILGGQPAFQETLHVGRPTIGPRGPILKRIREVLKTRWLTNQGPCVRELEKKICQFTHTRHCVLTCNATLALMITLKALECKGEVVLPSFTFIATAHATQWMGLRPVFCDINPLTHCLDVEQAKRLCSSRTSAILGVHLWGRPCDISGLERLAKRRRIKLIFDAAHAFGSSYQGKKIGGFGNAEIFSFHATKFFNTFEGGAITTNDADLANKLRLLSNFRSE